MLGIAATVVVGGPATAVAQTDISGTYRVNGTALDGTPYSGTAALSQLSGPVYAINWQTSAGTYSGVGILQGSMLAVGWGPSTCTVVGYQLQPNGSLLGTWTDLTDFGQGTETNTPTASGSGLAGSYTSVGTNPDATPYVGSLAVIPHGPIYEFQWQTGSSSFDGVGVQQGQNIAAGYDQSMQGRACGVALFSVAGDGSLNATWGMYGQSAAGSETWARL